MATVCPYFRGTSCLRGMSMSLTREMRMCREGYEACSGYERISMVEARPEQWRDVEPLTIGAILSYEVGDLLKMLVKLRGYGQIYGSTHAKVTPYRAEAMIAAADATAMLMLMCEIMGWSFGEIQRLGLERYRETMEQVKAGKRSS